MLTLELCWIQVGSTFNLLGTTSAHVQSKLGLDKGWPVLGVRWGYGSLNESMLAHFEVLLGLCWPIWGLCWGQVRPSRAMLGLWLCYFHDVTFIPKRCFKKFSALSICLSSTSPHWPASFTFRALSLPLGRWTSAFKGPCCSHVGVMWPSFFLLPQHKDGFWIHFRTVLGSCWRIDSRNAFPNNQQGLSTIPAKHFFSKTLLLPGWALRKCPWTGLCCPILGLCWGCVGPFGVYVGARFAQLGAMLGDFGAILFHEFTFIPKFCLKKLSPVACEAPTPFVQHHVSEKAESCLWGVHPMSAWRLLLVACEVPGNASQGVGGSARSPLSKARFASATLPPVTCEFQASSVFAPTSGLRVARTSERGSAAPAGPPS